MKKEYQKPSIYIENFALSQAIAKNCHILEDECTLGHPTSGDIYVCGWDDGTGGVTWSDSQYCNQIEKDETLDGVGCYNNPEGMLNLFEFS